MDETPLACSEDSITHHSSWSSYSDNPSAPEGMILGMTVAPFPTLQI